MKIAELVEAVDAEGDRLVAAAESAGLDAGVPSCPDWAVRDLLQHVGGVHRWATSYVTTGNRRPTTEEQDWAGFFAAPADDALFTWFRDGHAALVTALRTADPAMACWTFLPAPSPLAFWARRQAHETAIHRVDAELAAGKVPTVAPTLAADGIDELLSGFYARPRGRLVADPPVTLGVRAVDTTASWSIRVEPDRRVVTAGAADGDCVIAGAATDVYLFLWNRTGPDNLEVHGDESVLALWRTKARITWW
jgi:uncharacterized protein (TIGR03083 family)